MVPLLAEGWAPHPTSVFWRNSLALGGMASPCMTYIVGKLGGASAQGLGLLKEDIPTRGRRKWAEAWVRSLPSCLSHIPQV